MTARAALGYALLALMFLTACSTQPVVTGDVVPEDGTWSLRGKLGISAGQERGNFTIDWQQDGDQFEIHLLGPLGMGVANISGTDQGVVLRVPGEEPVFAVSADELLANVMGFNFPVAQMKYWVRGRPAPGRYRDVNHGFTQFGWKVEYLAIEQALPVRIRLTRPEVKLIMAIRQWTN
ncbi:MAG: lipoprotein insertase outer membrane protein LolB [Pseudomonadales bacterium]